MSIASAWRKILGSADSRGRRSTSTVALTTVALSAVTLSSVAISRSVGVLGLVALAAEPLRAQAPPPTAAAPASTNAAATAPTPSLVVVMDQSGSMWGRLGNERASKLVVTREALRAALERHGERLEAGFVTFPHRRRSECGTAEVVTEIEPLDLDEFMEPISRLNPRGRGPVVRGLQEAAKELAGRQGLSTIVLVQDNADNCGQDACAAVQELRKVDPRLTVHVLGLGLDEGEVSAASCVAVVTGGRFVNVADAATATAALDDMVRRAALGAPVPVPTPAARPKPAETAAVEAPPEPERSALPTGKVDGPPGVILYATLAVGGAPMDARVEWRVHTTAEPPRVVAGGVGPILELGLGPGKYKLTAEAGIVTREQRFEIGATGRKAEAVVFEAGLVTWEAGAARSPDGGIATLSLEPASLEPASATPGRAPEAAASGAGAPILLALPAEGRVVLPAGTWKLTVSHGRDRRNGIVTVQAGDIVPLDLAARVGTLSVTVAAPDGAVLDDALLLVHEDDPNSPSGRREIVRTTGALARVMLPPGTYYVAARLGAMEARHRTTVSSGSETRQVLVMSASEVTFGMRVDGKVLAADVPSRFEIERLDEPRSPPRLVGARAMPILLAEGRYRVTSRLGGANAIEGTEVAIAAGRPRTVLVDHRAGRARLIMSGPEAARAGAGDVFWEVLDAKGAPVWVGVSRSPTLWLQAGSYVVRALARGQRGERALQLASGADVALEVEVP